MTTIYTVFVPGPPRRGTLYVSVEDALRDTEGEYGLPKIPKNNVVVDLYKSRMRAVIPMKRVSHNSTWPMLEGVMFGPEGDDAVRALVRSRARKMVWRQP